MVKSCFFSLIFCFTISNVFSQEKTVLDKDFNELGNSSSSGFYFRVNPLDKKELSFTILDSLENEIGKESWKIDKNSGLVSERKIELFYPDGASKETLIITENNREITFFHENGMKKSVEKQIAGMISSRSHFNEFGELESVDKITKPEAKGGIQAWSMHLRNNLKYPKAAINAEAEGRVLVEFDINVTGKAENVQIKNKGESHASLEDEAKRMVETFKNGWIPLTINGIPEKTKMTIPIAFKRG
jgi:TonB family protein